MMNTKKAISTFSASALVLGSILFVPSAMAYISTASPGRPSAPTREQEQIQLQLAERARNLADQYESRRFGTGEEDPVIEEPVVSTPPGEALDLPEPSSERRSPRSDSPRTFVPPIAAEVRADPVAENLPNLPSSGLGVSTFLLALGLTGAIRGRKKFE